MNRILKHITGDRIPIQITLPLEEIHIVADQSQLEQAIINLVINACDAMWYGGKLQLNLQSYHFESDDCDLFYDELPEEDTTYACISLIDTGSGISEEHLSRIFEPFFTTKPAEKGTGLGLFQVYSTVRQHNGVISVQSRPGEGTQFQLFLPCVQNENTHTEQSETQSVIGGIETLLLVEDDPVVRRSTNRVLTRLGYDVIEAEHPREAIQLDSDKLQTVDMLLVDVMLPYVDGITFARQFQSQHPECKVLIISGYPEERLESSGMMPCEFPLLNKPYFRETLAQRIRNILDERKDFK